MVTTREIIEASRRLKGLDEMPEDQKIQGLTESLRKPKRRFTISLPLIMALFFGVCWVIAKVIS